MLNWDYWYWQKGLKRRYSRPAARANDLVVIEKVENIANERIIGKINERIDRMEDRLEASEDNISLPIMTALQELDCRLSKEIEELRNAVETGDVAILAELMRPKEAQEHSIEVPALFKEKHKELLSILLLGGSMSYTEIQEKMGAAKSSPRVYISEMQRMGFPIAKGEKGGKVLISIADCDKKQARETAKRFGFNIQA